ncbi:MAG: NapC/NirT family cytochrome c [Alphaproteobacteria bacterium]
MRRLKWIGGATGLVGIAGVAAGAVLGVVAGDPIDRYFSSNAFCAATCHAMTVTVAEELKASAHWTTKTGVRPECRDCHVSEGLAAAYWDHFVGLRELYAAVIEGIDTVEEFEERRAALADRVRLAMVATDSRNCRTCHLMEAIQPERPRGQKQHEEAREKGITCIVCHYNLVHKEAPLSAAFDEIVSSF